VTGLLPSRDAFAFTNAWPSQPALTLDTALGSIPIGNAAGGLCGGMVFAVLDFWHAGRTPQLERPAGGDPLYRFIVRRLLDSWQLPLGVLQYYRWMLAPDGDRAVDVLGRPVVVARGLAWRTIVEQWPAIRDDLDAAGPVALGLVTMATADVRSLALNHQVLAYAYRRDGALVTVRVYDPNSGGRDDVEIRFRDATPHVATAFAHNIGIAHPVRGFFRVPYAPVNPPS
jgi:hypothetical protein